MVDKNKLVAIASSSPTARAIFEVLSNRDREPRRGVTDLRRVKYDMQDDGIKVVPEEFVKPFMELQKAGVGKLIVHDGGRMEFKWAVSMKEVAAAVVADISEKVESTRPSINEDFNLHMVVVTGPGREARMTLPQNMTKEEARFLGNLLLDKAK